MYFSENTLYAFDKKYVKYKSCNQWNIFINMKSKFKYINEMFQPN